MKVNNIFKSIQGEGKYVGEPCLFIRLSGCNLNCSFCDTDFDEEEEMDVEDVADVIRHSEVDTVVWTGGEPTLQIGEIVEVMKETLHFNHHLETNASGFMYNLKLFDYIAFSPKKKEDAMKVEHYVDEFDIEDYDIKVVTDGESMNKELIPYATMLMSLTTFNEEKDKEIKQEVWEYCQENNIKYSPRLQIDLFGNKKGV